MRFRSLAAALILAPVLAHAQTAPVNPANLPLVTQTTNGAVPATGTPTGKVLTDSGTWQLVRNSLSLLTLGAVCDGAHPTQDTAAMNSAIALINAAPYGVTLTLPSGRCNFTQSFAVTLQPNGALTIQGNGPDTTELFFENDNDGIDILVPPSGSWVRYTSAGYMGAVAHVRDLSVVRDLPDASPARTAVHIHGDPAGGDGLGIMQGQVSNVVIRGTRDVSNFGAWDTGIWYDNIAQTRTDHVTGYANAAQNGAVLKITGTYPTPPFFSVAHSIEALNTHGMSGIVIGDWVQGVQLVNGSIGGNYGVNICGAKTDGFQISNVQISAYVAGIIVCGGNVTNHIAISNNYFLAPNPTYTAIQLADVGAVSITGNTFSGTNAASQAGVSINNSGLTGSLAAYVVEPKVISGNAFANLDSTGSVSVKLASVQNALVGPNQNGFVGNATYVSDDGAAGKNTFLFNQAEVEEHA